MKAGVAVREAAGGEGNSSHRSSGSCSTLGTVRFNNAAVAREVVSEEGDLNNWLQPMNHTGDAIEYDKTILLQKPMNHTGDATEYDKMKKEDEGEKYMGSPSDPREGQRRMQQVYGSPLDPEECEQAPFACVAA